MLHQFTLFGAVCLAICLAMVNANCNEDEKSCQKRALEPCGQTVKDACAKVSTSSCMDEICDGCGESACMQVVECRTKAGNCVDECMKGAWDLMSDCVGW